MSSEAASYFAEGLTSSSEGRWSAQHFFIELCVNPHLRTHDILVNAVDNRRQMAHLSDYNVAHNSQNNPEFCRKHLCILSRFGAL
jgi:hypothetical protein